MMQTRIAVPQLCVTLLVTSAAFGATPNFPAAGREVIAWGGATSLIEKPTNAVAQTEKDWAGIWEKVGKPAPKADLAKYFGVGIFLGNKAKGQYKISWSYQPSGNRKKIIIGYRTTQIGNSEGASRPYAVWLFPREIAKPGAEVIVWEKEEKAL